MTDHSTDTKNSNLNEIDHKNADVKSSDGKNIESKQVETKDVDLQNKTLATPIQNKVANITTDSQDDRDKNKANTNASNKPAIQSSDKPAVNITDNKRDLPPVDKVANSMSNDNQSAKPKSAEPENKKLSIVIAGSTYTIYCLADEEAELRAAEHYLNDFVSTIKTEAPNLNQENLLVLSCLNLYEQINANKVSAAERQQQNKQNESLLNKIMQEAHSVL